MRYRSGRINQITPAMRIEVARALWVPLEDAPKLLAYKGEKQMASERWSMWRRMLKPCRQTKTRLDSILT